MTEVNRKADNDGGNVEAGARRSTRRSERAPKLPAGSSSPRCHVVDTFRNRYILVEQLVYCSNNSHHRALRILGVFFCPSFAKAGEGVCISLSLSRSLRLALSRLSLTHSLTLSLSLSVSLPGMRVGGAGKKVVSRKIGKRMLLTLLPFCLSDGLRGYPV